MIAALYVATGGAYYGLPDVDPWDETRDARLYPGPQPYVQKSRAAATPIAFRDALIDLARASRP